MSAPDAAATVAPASRAIRARLDLRRETLPILLFGLLALVPFLARLGPESFLLALATRIVVLGLAAMSLDVLVGFGGLVSFGHAAYLGIGAYAVGILSSIGTDDLLIQVAVAILASAGFALVTGAIVLRTSGVAFIMITLAFGQMLFFLATALSAFGGDDGMTLAGRSQIAGAPLLKSNFGLYAASLAALAFGYGLLRQVTASRFGRVLSGARENATRMEAIGFAPNRFRLVAYVISGMLAGLAGVLAANASEFVSPAVMSWQRSGDLIFMVVLGGTGTLHGAIAGAAAFVLAEEVLSGLTERWRLLFGPLLVLAVLFARGGIAGAFGPKAPAARPPA